MSACRIHIRIPVGSRKRPADVTSGVSHVGANAVCAASAVEDKCCFNHFDSLLYKAHAVAIQWKEISRLYGLQDYATNLIDHGQNKHGNFDMNSSAAAKPFQDDGEAGGPFWRARQCKDIPLFIASAQQMLAGVVLRFVGRLNPKLSHWP